MEDNLTNFIFMGVSGDDSSEESQIYRASKIISG